MGKLYNRPPVIEYLRRQSAYRVTRTDIIEAVLELDECIRDLAVDIDEIDRRARPYGDGTDLDSRRRHWRGRGR